MPLPSATTPGLPPRNPHATRSAPAPRRSGYRARGTPATVLTAVVLALVASTFAACRPNTEPIVFGDVVRAAVARLENQIGTPEAVPPVDDEQVARIKGRVHALAGDRSLLRSLGITGAKDWGDGAVATLTTIVGSPTSAADERTTAIEMLAAIDTPRAAFALTAQVESHPQSWVRAQSAFHLAGTTQDQVIVRLIATMARERDEETRRWIGGTLARFGCHEYVTGDPDVVRRWRHGDPERRLSAPPPSPRLLLETWRLVATLADTGDGRARRAAVETLGQLPPFGAELLAASLRDADANVRRGAARALERMGGRASSAGTVLLQSLLGDPLVEAEAIAALGAVHHVAAAEEIRARLDDRSRALAVRVEAARALGRLDVPVGVPELTRALDASTPEALRREAALTLLDAGRERESLPVLCELASAPTSATPTSGAATGALSDADAVDDGRARVDEALDAWVTRRETSGASADVQFALEWRGRATAEERARLLASRWSTLVR